MDAFIGEIRIFPYSYAPDGWFWCNGASLPVMAYPALYSLIANTYGGDRNNFNIPDLRGLAVVAATQTTAPLGLSTYAMGEVFGTTDVTVPLVQHTHQAKSGYLATATKLEQGTAHAVVFTSSGNLDFAPPGTSPTVAMAPTSLGLPVPAMGAPTTGTALPHNNIQPYQTLFFAINWNGYYPDYP